MFICSVLIKILTTPLTVDVSRSAECYFFISLSFTVNYLNFICELFSVDKIHNSTFWIIYFNVGNETHLKFVLFDCSRHIFRTYVHWRTLHVGQARECLSTSGSFWNISSNFPYTADRTRSSYTFTRHIGLNISSTRISCLLMTVYYNIIMYAIIFYVFWQKSYYLIVFIHIHIYVYNSNVLLIEQLTL